MQLYRGNLLLSMARPSAMITPNNLAEVVQAVENGELRLSFSEPGSLAERTLLSPAMNNSEV